MAYATWNSADKSARITLSGADLIATADGTGNYQAVRDTQFKSTGKWYCELTVTSYGGLVASVPRLGLSKSTYDLISDFGTNTTDYAYGANGNKFNNTGGGAGAAYGATYTTADIISVLFDADAGTLIFWKNGASQGTAFTGLSGSFAITFMDVGGSVITANFGASAFTYTPTAGYVAWQSGNVVDVTGAVAMEVAVAAPSSFFDVGRPANVAMEVAVAASSSFTLSEQTANVAMEVAVAAPVEFQSANRDASVAMEIAVAATVSSLTANRDASVAIEVAVAAVVASSVSNVYSGSLSWTYDNTAGNLDLSYYTYGDLTYGFSVSGSMTAGDVMSAALEYSYALEAAMLPEAALTYSYSLEAEMSSGSVWTGDLRAAMPQANGTLLGESVYTGALSFPHWRVTAPVSVESIYTAALAVQRWSMHAEALAGAYYIAALETPTYSFAGVSYGAYALTAALTWPQPVVESYLTAAVAASFRTWVLNLGLFAMTEYDNFSFNSYAVYGDKVYSAGVGGVFPLTADHDNDNGTAIVGVVRTGKESFGSSYNKRLPRLYLVGKMLGDMKVSTITSQDLKRTYLLTANGIAGVQTRRVPIGRGPKSPHWQIEITNPGGEDFLISSLQAYPEQSKRRVV